MIKKISIDELKPGMEVIKLSSEIWLHLPYLYMEPGVIESTEQVARIKAEGYQYVFVQTETSDESDERRLNELLAANDQGPVRKERVPFAKAIDEAQITYESAMSYAMQIVNDVKLGRKMDYETALETASAIVESTFKNPDTLVCLSKLSAFDDYTFTHSINVAAISVVFGEFIGMSREELTLLGMAGMMHDLGKTTLPSSIINKPGLLTEAEYEEMKRHPIYGRSILENSNHFPAKVLEAVRNHHEKYNGTGYPDGLSHKDIPPFSRILCLADIYDALTSDRSYKNAVAPNKALGIMYGMRDQDFDPQEIQLFIKCLGIYPSGSFVKLNTGDYALVYESNSDKPLFPKIKIVMDKNMRPLKARDVDLANQDEGIEILDCADPSNYRHTLASYLTIH